MELQSQKLLAMAGRRTKISPRANAMTDVGRQFMRKGGADELLGQAIVEGAIRAADRLSLVRSQAAAKAPAAAVSQHHAKCAVCGKRHANPVAKAPTLKGIK